MLKLDRRDVILLNLGFIFFLIFLIETNIVALYFGFGFRFFYETFLFPTISLGLVFFRHTMGANK
jgi:hypothetical protein